MCACVCMYVCMAGFIDGFMNGYVYGSMDVSKYPSTHVCVCLYVDICMNNL